MSLRPKGRIRLATDQDEEEHTLHQHEQTKGRNRETCFKRAGTSRYADDEGVSLCYWTYSMRPADENG